MGGARTPFNASRKEAHLEGGNVITFTVFDSL